MRRFGVSMDAGLVDQFDRLVVAKGYLNRSEALRDLIKGALVRDGFEQGEREVAGTITLIYPYGTKLKHCPTSEHPSLDILANLQLHLDQTTCLKVMVVRGRAQDVSAWAQCLLGTKGALGQFTLSAVEDVEGVW